MIRSLAVSIALLTSTVAVVQDAQTPVNTPPPATLKGVKKLPPQWEATAREIYKTAVETPTVKGRVGENSKLATYLAGKLKEAGWAEDDIHVLPYTSVPGNDTAANRFVPGHSSLDPTITRLCAISWPNGSTRLIHVYSTPPFNMRESFA